VKYTRSNAKEYARENMSGVWAAIPYPFDGDDELDEAGLRQNVRRFVDHGLLDGIFCGHFMSEFWALTLDERRRAAEIVIDEVAGAVPVVVQTGHHSAKESVGLTHHAERAGATYAALGNPYFLAHSDQGIYEYFKYISDRIDIGILISNTAYTGISLSPELLNRLADLENVVAVKNPQPLNHTLETLRLAGDRLVISDPDERKWLMLMTHFGFRLYTSSPAPYTLQYPGFTPIKDYTAMALRGDVEGAAKLAYGLEAARNVTDKWQPAPWAARRQMPNNYLKAWCDAMGMTGGGVRPPLVAVTDDERRELEADLARVGLLREGRPAVGAAS
jgi:4-hydroxy-tetrahydrodipicolinate synthase